MPCPGLQIDQTTSHPNPGRSVKPRFKTSRFRSNSGDFVVFETCPDTCPDRVSGHSVRTQRPDTAWTPGQPGSPKIVNFRFFEKSPNGPQSPKMVFLDTRSSFYALKMCFDAFLGPFCHTGPSAGVPEEVSGQSVQARPTPVVGRGRQKS